MSGIRWTEEQLREAKARAPKRFAPVEHESVYHRAIKVAPGIDIDAVHKRKPGVTLNLRLVNSLNAREHYMVRAKRAANERKQAYNATKAVPLPCTVKITRIAATARKMDSDGMQAAAKNVRDGIADRLGVNDADPRVTWEYGQEKGAYYAVRIEIVRSLEQVAALK